MNELIFHRYNEGVTCDWYPVLGNHDWEGNPTAQIRFNADERWKMESYYYIRHFIMKNGDKVDFFFIDTTTLCPAISELFTDLQFSEKDAKEQLGWLETQLSKSVSVRRINFFNRLKI